MAELQAMWRVRGVGRVVAGWRRGMCSQAEVQVFWDLNGCGVAEMVHASRIAPNITHALRSSGFSGPVSIKAYGNTRALSQHNFLQSLLDTGVDLRHVPGAMKNLRNCLILDLLLWMKENPPPAHMLLISGEKEYCSIMHKLHMRGYKVLLAHPEGDVSPDLLSAASRVWVWDNMMKGTELVARTSESDALPNIANPLHSKCTLTRLFNHTEQQFSSSEDAQAERDAKSDDFSHDSKMKSQTIPKKVVQQVVDIVRLRPSGFTLAAFRRQLDRSNVVLDKNFYGHKDLMSFLLSVPKLKASLVWTSEKTRTYVFTEDFTVSTGIDNDSKGTLSPRCDYSKDSCSPKHAILQAEEEAKPYVGSRAESVSAFQQLDSSSANKEHSKESITEKATDSAAKSSGMVAYGKNAFSTAWKKALSKFSYMTKSLQFVGQKPARTEMAISETMLACKRIESELKNQHIDMEACTRSTTSQTLKEKGKQKISAQKVSSKGTPKGDGLKMPKGVMHDDVKVCFDCTTSDSAQENREILVKQSEDLEILEENGVNLCFPKRESKSNLQGKEHELENDVDTMSSFLQVGEYSILKEALKDTGLENQLCQDILSSLLNEGTRSLLTRATTMDDVLKILMESNLKGIAQLRHEERVQIAKILHDRIVMQIQNQTECSTQSKPMDKESLIRALTVTFNEIGTQNHMGDNSKASLSEKIVLSEEQDLHKMCKAKDGSKIDLYEADMILGDLKKLVLDSKSGVLLASLKPTFKKRYGYELNHKALGHSHLASFISSVDDLSLLKRNKDDHVILSSSHQIQKDGDSKIAAAKP